MRDFIEWVGWTRFIGVEGDQSPDPEDEPFVLLADGTVLLLEDGSGLLLEEAP